MAAPTKNMPELKVYAETIGNGGFVLDTRHFPLLVLAWIDELTIPMLDRASELRNPCLEYADQIGTKSLTIVDTSRMQVPSATVRKYSAELTMTNDRRFSSMVAYIPIMPNAVMRGVATAITWISGDKGTPNHIRADIDSAMSTAQKIFDELGIDFERPDNYQIPYPDKSAKK